MDEKEKGASRNPVGLVGFTPFEKGGWGDFPDVTLILLQTESVLEKIFQAMKNPS